MRSCNTQFFYPSFAKCLWCFQPHFTKLFPMSTNCYLLVLSSNWDFVALLMLWLYSHTFLLMAWDLSRVMIVQSFYVSSVDIFVHHRICGFCWRLCLRWCRLRMNLACLLFLKHLYAVKRMLIHMLLSDMDMKILWSLSNNSSWLHRVVYCVW